MSECLPIETLEERAAGVLSAELEDHVAGCARCQERLEQIRANDAMLRELLSADAERVEAALSLPAAVHSAPADLARGYEIVGEIQRGGQGIVYRAVQTSTKRTVALKTLHAEQSAAPRRQRRFEREIEVVAGLRHPNIVTLHESGVTSDGRLYFAMEHIEGLPLDRFLRRAAGRERAAAGSEGVEVVLRLFVKICAGVEYAHRRGVIHRDLKPGNILVDEEGEPHILDFGLAKATDSDMPSLDMHVTRPGEFMGTFAYAAPEQVQGDPEQISTRTDVYALGVILYEMLTGQHPYEMGGSLGESLRNIVEAEPERPSVHNRWVGDEVETIVLKCLAKEPDRRYQSAEAVRQDVEHFLAGEAIEAKRDSTWYVLTKAARRYKGTVTAALGFAVLVTGAAVVMAVLAHRAGEERNRANENAAQLDVALEESRVERGRLAGYVGNTAIAEELLWREHLGRRARAGDDGSAEDEPSATYWALWELYARQPCVRSWSAHGDSVACVSFSPQQDVLASSGYDGKIRLWRGATGELLRTMDGQCDRVHAVCFDPSGTVLASGDSERRVRIWNVADGRCLATLTGHEGTVALLAFGADGKALASSGTERSIRLWDTQTWRSTGTLVVPEGTVRDLCFDARGAMVAAVDDTATLRVWKAASAEKIVERTLGPGQRRGSRGRVRFAPGSHYLVSSYENDIRVWDTATWESVSRFVRAHQERISGLLFTVDGRTMVTASTEGTVKIWRFEAGGLELVATLSGPRGFGDAMDISRDGRTLATRGDFRSIRLWEMEPYRCARRLPDSGFSAHGLAYSENGRWLAVCGARRSIDPELRVWEMETGEVRCEQVQHADLIKAVAIHPDGRTLFTAGDDSTVRQFDLDSGREDLFASMESAVSSISLSPDGTRLACASDDDEGVVNVWNVLGRQWEREFREHTDRVAQVRFSPDGRWLASCSRDRTVVVRDLASGRTAEPLLHDEGARSLCFSADGRMLATGSDDGIIRLWDAETRQLLRKWEGHTQPVFDLRYRPDGKVLASASRGGEIRLWDGRTGRFLAALPWHKSMVFSLCFSPDGNTLVSGGTAEDGTLVWDLSYYDRHIAGNLEYQIGRMPAGTVDPAEVARLRAWAARVAGDDRLVEGD